MYHVGTRVGNVKRDSFVGMNPEALNWKAQKGQSVIHRCPTRKHHRQRSWEEEQKSRRKRQTLLIVEENGREMRYVPLSRTTALIVSSLLEDTDGAEKDHHEKGESSPDVIFEK